MQFCYLQDPINHYRKMTIARDVIDGEILFASAINKCRDEANTTVCRINPKTGKVSDEIEWATTFCAPIDVFSKPMARLIAGMRLNHGGDVINVIDQEEDVAPHLSILEWFSENGNEMEQRICDHALDTMWIGGHALSKSAVDEAIENFSKRSKAVAAG